MGSAQVRAMGWATRGMVLALILVMVGICMNVGAQVRTIGNDRGDRIEMTRP